MHDENNWFNGSSKIGSVKTLSKCNNTLKQMLQELGIEPDIAPGGLRAKNTALVQQIKSLLQDANREKINEIADFLPSSGPKDKKLNDLEARNIVIKAVVNLEEAVKVSSETPQQPGFMIDDIAPNAFKQSLAAAGTKNSVENGHNVISARKLFREVLDDLRTSNVVQRRINVVESNFPRMYGYLLEAYEDGIGLSPYGRGRNLNTAKVRVD